MTITEAFKDLTLNNTQWYKLTGMAKIDADKFQLSFLKSGFGEAEVKRILNKAGYSASESWSKDKPAETSGESIAIEASVDPQNKVIIPPGAPESEIALIKQANNPLGNPNAK